jgi:hypothetical protein
MEGSGMAYACDIDPFDALTDLEVQGYRMQPVWQVCAAVDGWGVCETDICGRFVVRVVEFEKLDDALATARLLNRAEGLRTV